MAFNLFSHSSEFADLSDHGFVFVMVVVADDRAASSYRSIEDRRSLIVVLCGLVLADRRRPLKISVPLSLDSGATSVVELRLDTLT